MSTLPSDAPSASLPPIAPPGLTAEVGPEIDYDSLVTEDHKPVDRIFVEKLYRLLTRCLYASWPGPGEGRPFLVLVNVGWFYQRTTPAVVPDCLLSLDVTGPPDLQVKQGHSYYQWDMGKQPDVVIEVVSDRTGGEEGHKKNLYARLGVPYYAVFDPKHLLSGDTLRTYELRGAKYQVVAPAPGRRSAWGCGCGRASSRGLTTSGCAGATQPARSSSPAKNAPGSRTKAFGKRTKASGKRTSASANWKRNFAGRIGRACREEVRRTASRMRPVPRRQVRVQRRQFDLACLDPSCEAPSIASQHQKGNRSRKACAEKNDRGSGSGRCPRSPAQTRFHPRTPGTSSE